MIWPFTELSRLRVLELDHNRQIAALTTRLEILHQTLTSENQRLQSHLNQYIDDLRRMSNLKSQDQDPNNPSDPADDIIMTPMLRSKVNELKGEFEKNIPYLNMLAQARGFYERSAELNPDSTDSEVATDESSTTN